MKIVHLRLRLTDHDGADVNKRVLIAGGFSAEWPNGRFLRPAFDIDERMTWVEAIERVTPVDELIAVPDFPVDSGNDFGLPRIFRGATFISARVPASSIGLDGHFVSLLDEWNNGSWVTRSRAIGGAYQAHMYFKMIDFDDTYVDMPEFSVSALLPSRALALPNWVTIGTGGSVVAGNDLVAPQGVLARFACRNSVGPLSPLLHPYRYCDVLLDAARDGTALLEIESLIAVNGVPNPFKAYEISVREGRHTYRLDLANPDGWRRAAASAITPKSDLPNVDVMNCYEGTEPSFLSSYPDHGPVGKQGYVGRYTGVYRAQALYMQFTDNNITFVSLSGAHAGQGFIQQGATWIEWADNTRISPTPIFGPAECSMYGHCDFIDRFRAPSSRVLGQVNWGGMSATWLDPVGFFDSVFPTVATHLSSPANELWLDKNLNRYPPVQIASGGSIFASLWNNVCTLRPTAGPDGSSPASAIRCSGQMIWGWRSTASAIPGPNGRITVRTVDEGASFAKSYDIAGYGGAAAFFHPPTLPPFLWDVQNPSRSEAFTSSSGFPGISFINFETLPENKLTDGASYGMQVARGHGWGSVDWCAFNIAPSISAGVDLVSGKIGYMIAFVSLSDASLNVILQEHTDTEVCANVAVDPDPCKAPALAYRREDGRYALCYAKDGGIFVRISYDEGRTWSEPTYGAPLGGDLSQTRIIYNVKCHEWNVIYLGTDRKMRVSAFDDYGDPLGNFPEDEDGIGGLTWDDASFGAHYFEDHTSGLDVVGYVDGVLRRFRTLEDSRSFKELPIT